MPSDPAPAARADETSPLRVWDLPTRLFHWALAAVVIGLVATGLGGVMAWHFRLGYTALALLLFRIVWGFVGGHWSRFANFVYAPGTVLAYLRGRGRPEHGIGHNPLGALSVFALLAILALQVWSGLSSDDAITFTGPLARFVSGDVVDWASGWHKSQGKWLVIGLAALHVLAVLFYLLVRRNNLVAPMVTGDKPLAAVASSPSRDDGASRTAALVLFAACAAFSAWVASLEG